MSTGSIAIVLIVATTVGLGLIGGALTAALLEGNSTSKDNPQIARERHHLSRTQRRSLLIPALFLAVIGIGLLFYGYGVKNAIWLSLGYGFMFFSALFVGGFLYQTNL